MPVRLIEPPVCAGCAACCHHLLVEVREDDVTPRGLVHEIDDPTRPAQRITVMRQRDSGACAALDPVTGLCSVYDERPNVCRDFQMHGPDCIKVLARAASAS